MKRTLAAWPLLWSVVIAMAPAFVCPLRAAPGVGGNPTPTETAGDPDSLDPRENTVVVMDQYAVYGYGTPEAMDAPDISVSADWPQENPPDLGFDKPEVTIPDVEPTGDLVPNTWGSGTDAYTPWPPETDFGGGGAPVVPPGGGGPTNIPPGGGPQPGLFKLVKPGG